MEIVENLKKAGLTEAEAIIFENLLKINQTTTGEMIRMTGLQSSTIYHCLSSLINQGLISFIKKNNVKYFQVEPTENLIEFIKKQEKDLLEAKTNLTELILEKLRKKQGNVNERYEKVFEGWRGVRSAFTECVNSLKRKSTIYVFTLSSYAGADKDKARNLINYIRDIRLKRNIYEKVLINEKEKIGLGKEHELTKNTEVKYLPENLVSPAVIHIYNDVVLIAVTSEPPLVFVVKNKFMAESFKNYFNLLWKIAK